MHIIQIKILYKSCQPLVENPNIFHCREVKVCFNLHLGRQDICAHLLFCLLRTCRNNTDVCHRAKPLYTWHDWAGACFQRAKRAQNRPKTPKPIQLSVSQYQQIHGRLTRCSKRNSHDLQKVHMSDHLSSRSNCTCFRMMFKCSEASLTTAWPAWPRNLKMHTSLRSHKINWDTLEI